MNATAWLLLVATAAVAAVDWVAVGTGRRNLELVAKPATMVALIATAVALDPASEAARTWFVVALVWSLAGDVFLMLADEDRWFVPGLASFLVGHVAYVVGLAVAGVSAAGLVVGVVVVALLVAVAGRPIVGGARATDPRLGVPVASYIVAISAMVVMATGSGVALAIVGAGLFYLSDFTIGWTRFVGPVPAGRLVIITTYHAAQVLLVTSLVVAR